MQKRVSIWSTLLILLLLLLLGVSSCKDKEEKEIYFLKVEMEDGSKVPSNYTVPAEGSAQIFVVKSNGSWEITTSGDDDWLNITPTQGVGDGLLSIEIEENSSLSNREVDLSIKLNKKEITVITIMQKGEEEEDNNNDDSLVADLLDIKFNADGTAEDISQRKNDVITVDGFAMMTLYNPVYDRYMARFNHTPGVNNITNSYYKADYSSMQDFKDALADGHSLETFFMLDLDSPLPNAEIKLLASHQRGGTGLMLANSARNNSITFLPNVGSGWVWTNSGVVPERGKYYHVVGVWNKQEGKSYVYVNGELKATVNTSGNFNFPDAGSNWFSIGSDPRGESTAEMGLKGDVVIARIYDKPLEGNDVEKLWGEVKDLVPAPSDMQISKLSFHSKRVQIGASYTIKGEGFMSGDKIKLTPVSGGGTDYLCDGTAAANSLTFKIPENFVTGRYRFFVVRGSQELDIGFATLTVVDEILNMTQVIAHRGYWKGTGAAQNSIASLVKAQELNVYGSEFDVWITTDDVVVLNHDATIEGIRIETSTYDDLKNVRLSNGEKIPTLEDYLIQGKKDPSTKLILEIKTHKIDGNNDRAAAAVVQLISDANMTEQVEYIAFSLDVCTKLLELQPNAVVAYLNGDRTPQQLYDLGIKGIDYKLSVLRNNKNWITESHNLGMTVNVWTVNAEGDLREVITDGVDFITTDEPVLASQLLEDL